MLVSASHVARASLTNPGWAAMGVLVILGAWKVLQLEFWVPR